MTSITTQGSLNTVLTYLTFLVRALMSLSQGFGTMPHFRKVQRQLYFEPQDRANRGALLYKPSMILTPHPTDPIRALLPATNDLKQALHIYIIIYIYHHILQTSCSRVESKHYIAVATCCQNRLTILQEVSYPSSYGYKQMRNIHRKIHGKFSKIVALPYVQVISCGEMTSSYVKTS